MRRGWIVAVLSVLVLAGCGGGSVDGNDASSEAVTVNLVSVSSNEALALEKRLAARITREAVGAYDETRWHAADGEGAAELLAYGPDADALWEAMKPIIVASDPKPGSHAIKIYGDPLQPSAKQVRVDLAS